MNILELNVVKSDYLKLTSYKFSSVKTLVKQIFPDLGIDSQGLDSCNNFNDLNNYILNSWAHEIPTGETEGETNSFYGVRAFIGGYSGFEIKLNFKQFLFVGFINPEGKPHFLIRVEKDLTDTVLGSFVSLSSNIREDFNIPRLDIQQTVESPNPNDPKSLFLEAYEAQKEFEKQTKKKPRKILRIHDEGLHQTIEIGSRMSQQYTRLYLKTVETSQSKIIQLLRAEVELKPPLSNAVVNSIVNKQQIEEKMVQSFKTVLTGLENKTIFTKKMRENVENFEGKLGWPEMKKITIPSSTLEWFKKSCVPNLKRLLENPETSLETSLLLDDLIEFRDKLGLVYLFDEEDNKDE